MEKIICPTKSAQKKDFVAPKFSKRKLLAQGAEAIITLNKNTVTKSRVSKSYRIPELDEKIRKSRTKKEAKLLEKIPHLIPAPKLISSDLNNKTIQIEFIKGKKLSEHLDSLSNSNEICNQIGENIAILHDNEIIHGDLTTSNMILSEKDNKVYFIDFGLSFTSNKAEDKAVDLHLIKQALEAKHFKHHKDFFKHILESYCTSKNAIQVLKRLEKVELRGRYKQQF